MGNINKFISAPAIKNTLAALTLGSAAFLPESANAFDCKDNFQTEIIGENQCVKVEVTKTQEKFTERPRLVVFFHGDGQDVLSYFDKLISTLKIKVSNEYKKANTIFLNALYPIDTRFGANMKKEGIAALAHAIARFIIKENPQYIDFVGLSSGADRELLVQAIEKELFEKYGLKLPIDRIIRFNGACDREKFNTAKGYNGYKAGLMDPILFIQDIREGIEIVEGRSTNDNYNTDKTYTISNNECLQKFIQTGKIVTPVTLNGAGHKTLGKSNEYRKLMIELLSPPPQGYITTAEYKESIKQPHIHLAAVEEEIYKIQQRQNPNLTPLEFLQQNIAAPDDVPFIPNKTIIVSLDPTEIVNHNSPLLHQTSVITFNPQAYSGETFALALQQTQKLNAAQNIILIDPTNQFTPYIKNLPANIMTAQNLNTAVEQYANTFKTNEQYAQLMENTILKAQATGIIPSPQTAQK